MNATPPPIPPEISEESTSLSTVSALRFFAIAIGLTFLSDFLLRPVEPKLSWGLYLLAIAAALVLNRPNIVRNRLPLILIALLVLTAVQSMVEISFTNVVVGLSLVVALVGETAYPALRCGWERISEALWAFIKSPGRWAWAFKTLAQLSSKNTGGIGIVMRAICIGMPALALGLVFAAILGSGNAIFGSWITHFFKTLWDWLAAFDLSLGHLFFYGLMGTVALWALHPSDPANTPRPWARTIPKISVANVSIAWWRNVTILAVLNILFFVVNTIDALYLWVHTQLPVGMNYTEYVHEGVNSLIAAVLLSAVVLSALFQQDEVVSQSRALKRLSCFWIAQNFVLIAGVMLRLVRYIQMSQLTPPRVYAICFVMLVAAGFVLLAIHIARNRTLNWLILSNALATWTLFFILQFLNIDGWVANYNVSNWEQNPSRALDMGYLKRLGFPAWPAFQRIADSKKPQAVEATRWLKQTKDTEQSLRNSRNWRSWQARYEWNLDRLLESK